MEPKPPGYVDKAPLPLYPPPDFSVPPPALQEPQKSQQTNTTTRTDGKIISRDNTRRERNSSREKQHSRYSPQPSRSSYSSSSREYRSQSRYSTTSRYSSREYSSRRSPDRSYKRKRSRSKSHSRPSSRRSPSFKPSSSRRDRETSRANSRRSPRRETRESTSRKSSKDPQTEREKLLAKWRKNYCETSEQISKKLMEMANDEEQVSWIRSSPADIYYRRTNGNVVESTARLDTLCTLFDEELLKRSAKIKATQAPYAAPARRRKIRVCRHKSDNCSSDSSSNEELEEDRTMEELSHKTQHPYRLHSDLWHNETGEMNDGPLCRCSAKSRRNGLRHGMYPGETGFTKCAPNSNNGDKLFHYRITISPPTNFLTKTPTIIKHDEHEFIFEGFSLLTHERIGTELPICKVIRFNIEYTISYVEEKLPENFTIRELDLFFDYLFIEILELVDFSLKPSFAGDSETCQCYHFYPRFVRDLADNGKEVLAMSEVLQYLLHNSGSVVNEKTLQEMNKMGQYEWQDYVDTIKGMVVTNPGKRPCSVRIDQLDRKADDIAESTEEDGTRHPVIVHFGIRPPQLSYAGNPEYQKAWREYVKFRHLIANMSKPSFEDKRKLEAKENRLQEMRTQGRMKRNVTVAITSKGFYRTGIMCDIVQHAMLIPVLTTHLRFHRSLEVLENTIGYKFNNRYLLQLALTHPSYKENFGTNPDHARNSLTNCGIRQPEYGDKKIHFMNTRKRGINTLISIMSRFGKEHETDSNITHNERLEFLGDAVVEFITSIHLFHLFPDLEEGGLATYRAAIVQNQHLAVLARRLGLEKFMLYAHGSDLCHELELRHAMANCFEAMMGALFLDADIKVADKVFSIALMDDPELKEIWDDYPRHPLQLQEPNGDRHWIEKVSLLQNLRNFEESIGVEFTHIRLLARAFTDRSIGFTNLTLGSNQRLEFLGDTVLQLICSEFLYRHFPEHHEGHLSLLRSSLVNNRTQAVVCDDLGMTKFAVYSNPKADLKTKDRADLLEAFLGSLYVDKDLEYCEVFCHVCLFPRLQDFIMNQDWNDPKSKLQQCCLTLRTMDGNEPDIPYYKVVESTGPTNTRVYKVAVYFREKRLASSTGHSIQQAEMNAAKKALEMSKDLFPQLDHQKRVIANSLKRQKVKRPNDNSTERVSSEEPVSKLSDGESRLPKQYQKRINIISDASDISSSSLDESDENFESDSDVEAKIVKKRAGSDDEGLVGEEKDKKEEDELPTEPISSPEVVKATAEDVYSELSEGEFDEFED